VTTAPYGLDPRTPVLVGLGRATTSAPVTELMTEAALAAGLDAGSPTLLAEVDRVALTQGTWSLTDPARAIATAIGAPEARTHRYEVGVSQQEVINDALASIMGGDADVVLVVGGEARVWERRGGEEADRETRPPDVIVTRPPDFVAPVEIAAGIVWPPIQQYALIENALARHESQDTTTHRNDVAALWSRFNQVAQDNPLAAFPAPRSATDIATPGRGNRPLAYPYNKWHSSQWTVDEAAGLLFCSSERAAAAGVPRDRWVFPLVALHVSEAVTLTARRDLHAWPAMAGLGRTAAAHLGRPLAELAIAEVYSCFPAAVRVQQRALGLNPEGTPTVIGGMSFAGGPFNNYVLGATAAVAGLLRADPSEPGLVTTVSGMLSKPGLAVWSATPPAVASRTLITDMAGSPAVATPGRPVAPAETPGGPAVVASFTVTYDGGDPPQADRTAIVADLPDGTRTAATCEDAGIARAALSEGLIGQTVHIAGTTFSP
jgi:acetyl-CoA C-acetyltransferase